MATTESSDDAVVSNGNVAAFTAVQAVPGADPHAPARDPDSAYDPEQPFAAAGYTIDRNAGKTYVLVETGDGPRTLSIPVAIEPVGRIRESGVVVGLWVKLTDKSGDVREVYIAAEDMGGRDPYGKLLRATGYAFTEGDAWNAQLKHVKRLLIMATTHRGVRALDVLAVPYWDGDKLHVPGITDIPMPRADNMVEQHYGPELVEVATLDPGDDADAKEAWRSIITVGAQHPKLGLAIGLALASPYLSRLRTRGTTGHIGGVSTKGKTLAGETAISTIGNPKENEPLAGTWDETYVHIVARMKQTGGLPYMLDETSLVSGSTEQNLDLVPYAVWSGKERGRGDREGNAKEQARFTLNLISTGERDLATSKGGSYARVVQLNAPLVEGDDDGAIIDMVHGLALAHHGWPLWWLVKSGWAPTELDLEVPTLGNPVAQRHARALAAAKLAFDYLAYGLGLRIADGAGGTMPLTLDLEAATAELVADLAENASDADRLFEELWTDFVTRSTDYGTQLGLGQVVGRDLGETWLVTPARVKAVAKGIGLDDIRPVVRELAKQGRVLVGSEKNKSTRRKALREGEPVVRVYELVKPLDAVTPSGHLTGHHVLVSAE